MPDFPVDESFVTAANAAQLHDEARGAVPASDWHASFTHARGQLVYRVEGEVDSAAVAAAIAAHVANPDYGLDADHLALRALRDKANLTAADVAAAVKLMLRRQR